MKILPLLVAIVACGGTPPSAAVASFGSFTPEPKTASPAPTLAPTPTPTISPLLGDAVAAAVKASGFPIAELTVFTAETDPNKLLGRPGQYAAKVSWRDTRVTDRYADQATIEVFPDSASLQMRFTYIDGIMKSSPLFLQWMYRNDARLALLRLPKELTPDQAKAWEDWFKKI